MAPRRKNTRNSKRKSNRRSWKRQRKMPKKGEHFFKRVMATQFNILDTATINSFGLKFRLVDLPSYTEFTSLFDQYKIAGIGLKFMYSHNMSPVYDAVDRSLPVCHTVIDYDDAEVLVNENDFLQYETLKTRRLDKTFSLYLRPMICDSLYQGAFTGYGVKRGWIDCSSLNIEHYGVKICVDPIVHGVGENTIGILSMYTTFYLKFRGVR